jgi:recombination protein RecA
MARQIRNAKGKGAKATDKSSKSGFLMSGDGKRPEGAERDKALELALDQIDKQFGKGSVMRLGDDNNSRDIDTVSSGSLGLDVALGVGGLPRGRIIEVYGPESSGKTTLALHAVAEVQKTGGVAAFIDAEHALDVSYARKLGVNTSDLLISQPDNGEQALEITDTLIRSGAVDVLVVDSVAALVPRAEIEGEMGDSHVGLQARLMSQALRKLTGTISRSNTILIFINQIRMKIGVMFGSPETTTGGNALKFYASVRLDIRRIGAIKQGEQSVGNRTRVRVVKNKIAPPFREAEFDILYGHGVNRQGEILDLGVEFGLVEKSGSWYSYGEDRIGQGRENVCEFLRENPDISNTIESALRSELGLAGSGTPELTVIEGGASGSDSAAGDAEGSDSAAGDAEGNDSAAGDAEGNDSAAGDAAEPVAEEAKESPTEQAVAE